MTVLNGDLVIMLVIRTEKPQDIPSIRIVNEQAFDTSAEADIVDTLRRTCSNLLSLVAEQDGDVVGYVLFSPVVVDGPDGGLEGMGLAPMAVLPQHQRQGIGSHLAQHGLDILHTEGCPFVIVLGHPEYYPRFGFEPASKVGLTSQWQGVPDEAFMVHVMNTTALKDVSGIARYRDEFDEAM